MSENRVDDWLPFKTAPEDGSEILVYRVDAGVFTALFIVPEEDDDCFWSSSNGEDLTGDLPTLWMPFPKSPKMAGEEL